MSTCDSKTKQQERVRVAEWVMVTWFKMAVLWVGKGALGMTGLAMFTADVRGQLSPIHHLGEGTGV